MKIIEVKENKKQYLDLLLLADEQEDMVDRYLDNGKMYVLDDNGIKCECVVTDEGNGVLEIKNIATVPEYQGKGYARALIEFIVNNYREQYAILQVGTGDSPLTIPFYEKCGFVRSHIISNFFIDNYDHPIYESGIQLVDMVYSFLIFATFGSDQGFSESLRVGLCSRHFFARCLLTSSISPLSCIVPKEATRAVLSLPNRLVM